MSGIGDRDSAIRIGLDLVQVLLIDDCRTEALALARHLAETAFGLDQAEPSRRRALTAQVCAYLRDAAVSQVWTADLVAGLSRYVDQITRQRPVDFIPPMPLSQM